MRKPTFICRGWGLGLLRKLVIQYAVGTVYRVAKEGWSEFLFPGTHDASVPKTRIIWFNLSKVFPT